MDQAVIAAVVGDRHGLQTTGAINVSNCWDKRALRGCGKPASCRAYLRQARTIRLRVPVAPMARRAEGFSTLDLEVEDIHIPAARSPRIERCRGLGVPFHATSNQPITRPADMAELT